MGGALSIIPGLGFISNTAAAHSDNTSSKTVRRKKIAIVGGGGPSGLATLRAFLERPEFAGPDPTCEVRAFERREDIGGVWLPAPAAPDIEGKSASAGADAYDKPWTPPTPMYNSVTTNGAHPLMAFHEFPFPPETPLYPPASVVLDYLRSFADHYDLKKHIEFRVEVQGLRWDPKLSKWFVKTLDSKPAPLESEAREEEFDAVVVGNGHLGVPHYPRVPGIEEWKASSKRTLVHSMWYREPSMMKDSVVLVVGGGATGTDIIDEACTTARRVIHSTSDGKTLSKCAQARPRLVELRESDGMAIYEDGTTDSGIEMVMLATGYDLGFPFFTDLEPQPPPSTPIPDSLTLSEFSITPLAQDVFPLRTYPAHTLAFIGIVRATSLFLPTRSPFRVVREFQEIVSEGLPVPELGVVESWDDESMPVARDAPRIPVPVLGECSVSLFYAILLLRLVP